MGIPSPQTIAGQFFARISVFLADGYTPNDIERAALVRDADKLLKVDPVKGHLAKAAIAAIEWDLTTMDYHYGCAGKLSGDPVVSDFCAIGNQAVLRYSVAADFATKAYVADRLNKNYAERALAFLLTAGRVSECWAMYQDAKKTFGDALAHSSPKDIHALMQEHGIPDDAVAQMQEVVFGFLRARQISPRLIGVRAIRTPAEGMISFSIELDLPIEEVFALDRDLTDVLFDSVESLCLEHFWIGLQSSGEYAAA